MKKTFGRRAAAPAMMAAWLCLGAAALDAAPIPRRVDNLKHALGWDNLHLDLVEKDAAGRPTLESESNKVNRVARRTTYYADGKKASQIFTVVELATDKTLYLGKRDWIENGDLGSTFERDDVFNAKGHPQKGWINERHFRRGRLVMDVKRKYSDETGDWTVMTMQTLSYYEDGDLQERITNTPTSPRKWEVWGQKTGKERKLTVKTWNSSSKSWQ